VEVLVLPDLAPVITIAAGAPNEITMGTILAAPKVGPLTRLMQLQTIFIC
jgi:hypothetical protein